MGVLLVCSYFVAVIPQPILFGIFLNDLLTTFCPETIGFGTWFGGVILSTAIVAMSAYPGIEMSAKASTAVTILGVLVVAALAVTIVFSTAAEGRNPKRTA